MKNSNYYNFKPVAYCEIDKYASKSYSAIHGVSETLNYVDVTKMNPDKLVPFNVLAGGSPCQDFSVAGRCEGAVWTCAECGEEYNPLTVHYSERKYCPNCHSEDISKTRSSLLIHFLDIVRANMPPIVFFENVKNLVSIRFKDSLDMFVKELEEYGYNVHYKVLNGKDYGIPQNRERVIVLAIRRDVDNGMFKFPNPYENCKTFNDLLDDCAYLFDGNNIRIIIDENIMPYVRRNIERDKDIIVNSDKNIFRMKCKSGFQDNVVGLKVSPTITASNHCTILLQKIHTDNGMKYYFKRITAKEALEFMGFSDEDYEKASAVVSNSQIYKQAGNSIIVDVVYAVFKELFKVMPYLFTDIKLLHLFSGIGSVEKGIARVVEEANAEIKEKKAA